MSTALNIPPQIEVVDRPLDTQMTISMGPQHPSTHGVLRIELVLDGEMVVKATPDIGYLHTGMEKLFEYKKYQQGIVITDRMDYLNPLGNNLAYVMAAEKLLQLEIPERAQTIRVLFCELQRIASHLVWLGTHALDMGAMTVFFYCFREREKILNLIEAASGGRLTPSYFRIGGLMMDLPSGFERRVKQFLAGFPKALQDFAKLLTGNRIFRNALRTSAASRLRTRSIGDYPARRCVAAVSPLIFGALILTAVMRNTILKFPPNQEAMSGLLSGAYARDGRVAEDRGPGSSAIATRSGEGRCTQSGSA